MNMKFGSKNHRRGETHQNADLTDWEVELMRRMHEDEGIGYRRLSKLFETPRSTVQRLCTSRNR